MCLHSVLVFCISCLHLFVHERRARARRRASVAVVSMRNGGDRGVRRMHAKVVNSGCSIRAERTSATYEVLDNSGWQSVFSVSEWPPPPPLFSSRLPTSWPLSPILASRLDRATTPPQKRGQRENSHPRAPLRHRLFRRNRSQRHSCPSWSTTSPKRVSFVILL
jgi:hypothetical protein